MNQLTIDGLIAGWKKQYAQNTLYTRVGILRSLLKTLQLFGAPPLTAGHIKPGKPRPRIATQTEIEQLLSIAPAHWKLFILLCWKTALRHGEAIAVTPRSYDKETQTVAIKVKGGATRTVPVTRDIANLVESTLDGDQDESCVYLLAGRTLTRTSVYSAWANLCRKKGIVGLRPHDLRRTTANHVLNTTGDIRDVQAYLGHENLRSTAHYIIPFGDRRVRELQQLLKFHSEVKQ
jgi:integrase